MSIAKHLIAIMGLCWTLSALGQLEHGKASYYASKFEGRPTASGELYEARALTAAHKTLPFGSLIKVTNLNNGLSVIVKVNDRGPFVEGRLVDLSFAAAQAIGMVQEGIVDVSMEILSHAIRAPGKLVHPDYFSLQIREANPSGFGVQVMSFAHADNYVAFVEGLQKKHNPDSIILQRKTIQGQPVIGIILHQFLTRSEAETFRHTIADTYPGCYVVDFALRD